MIAKSILSELLASIAPRAICNDCIADRVPIHYKANIDRLISALPPSRLERAEGECCACVRSVEVIRLL
jgi:hypothetical protein